jgi:hypothetical protein
VRWDGAPAYRHTQQQYTGEHENDSEGGIERQREERESVPAVW